MTTALDASSPADPADSCRNRGLRLDRLLEWMGDRVNPILVKETRQSLKSRQFLMTFTLVLLANWGWTLLGMATFRYRIQTSGPDMLMGYWLVLAFPLMVMIPFLAFRSLAVEREDRTYELLSISDLTPRQIVSGKLVSVAAQMMIYLSVSTPCLAFTYLLRGVELPTMLLSVGMLVFVSAGLSAVGLFLGTLAGTRQVQVVLSVLLVIGLLWIFVMIWAAAHEAFFGNNLNIEGDEFWVLLAVWATAFFTYFALVFHAAVAQITFESDNRSTRLRVIMLVQQLALFGWAGYFWSLDAGDAKMIGALLYLSVVHWYLMGTMMTGERSLLSMRVRRGLPQSFLGRLFLTWFNPGPGTGFAFAVSGMLLALVVAALTHLFSGLTSSRAWHDGFGTGYVSVCYAVAYLGAGFVLMRLARRRFVVGIPFTLLTQIVLLAVGVLGPMVLSVLVEPTSLGSYSMMMITNPFWSVVEFADAGSASSLATAIWTIVSVAALAMLILNVPAIVAEMRYLRVERPKRVAEEDAALGHEKREDLPPVAEPRSPWDQEPSV